MFSSIFVKNVKKTLAITSGPFQCLSCYSYSKNIAPQQNASVKNINRLGTPGVSLDRGIHETLMSIYSKTTKGILPRNLDNELIDAIRRFDYICDYNGPNRELYATPALLSAYKALNQEKNLTTEDIELACILSWCFEMTTTAFILVDDSLDDQEVRWKKSCIYNMAGAKVAVDIRLLHISGYLLLKQKFKDHASYGLLLKLFSDCMFKSCFGQTVDLNTSLEFAQKRDLELISMKTYSSIVKYKTSYIMFKTPVLAAMYLTHTTSKKGYLEIVNMLDKLSEHFQIMNDMWDCYGNFDTLGRVGTDIRMGKSTWLTSSCIQYANDKQLELLRENYGKDDQKFEQIVKNIYREVGIIEIYKKHKSKLWDDLDREIKSLSSSTLQNLMLSLIDTYLNIDEDLVVE